MAPVSSPPLHGGAPPKPSPFPLIALTATAGGVFAANVRWRAEPAWAAPVAVIAGLGACLLVFVVGCRLLKSRRAGFLGALSLAVLGASRLHPPPFETGHLALLLLVPAAAAVGWALDRFREGLLGRGGDLAGRVMLGLFGLVMALGPIAARLGFLGDTSPLRAAQWATLACLAAAGAVVTGMSLAGDLKRWPTPEAALVLSAGFLIWGGLA